MVKDLSVRFRVDLGPKCSIGIGKIELLEGIAASGSLSQAARQMRMSYRRAWLLLADMNASFDEPVACATTGGRGGGGAVLTDFGKRVVAGYRTLETGLQPLARRCFAEVGERVRAPGTRVRKKIVPVTSIRRKAAARQRGA